jgi:hypothetical protein
MISLYQQQVGPILRILRISAAGQVAGQGLPGTSCPGRHLNRKIPENPYAARL